MEQGLETLGSIYKGASENKNNPISKEDTKGINLRLLLLVQLSTLQGNIAWEIEQIFRKYDMFDL